MSPAAQQKTDEFQTFLHTMQDVLGVMVDEENQSSVSTKLLPVLEAFGFESMAALAEAMQDGGTNDLRLAVLQAITEHDSVWFAYPEICGLLRDYVLPGLINRDVGTFRTWIVGCGKGPVAYSLAMTIDNFRQQYGLGCNIEIVATDLSDEVVKRAAEGRFSPSMLSGLPDNLRQKYLSEEDGVWVVDEPLRSTIHFTTCDLLSNIGSMGDCDLIICPDELIYFSNGVKRGILEDLAALLDPSGILIVSANEPVVPFCDKFGLVNHESGIFYRQLPDA